MEQNIFQELGFVPSAALRKSAKEFLLSLEIGANDG